MSRGQIQIAIVGVFAILIWVCLNLLWAWQRGDLATLLSGGPLPHRSIFHLLVQGVFGVAIVGITVRAVFRLGRREAAKRMQKKDSNEYRDNSNGH